MDQLVAAVNFHDWQFQFAALTIVLAPLLWNILARMEYKTRFLTKLMCGNKYWGCYLIAIYVFAFSSYRDYQFSLALESQPTLKFFDHIGFQVAAAILFAVGGILVVSSMWALGLTGTYLGDYFRIYMKERVTSFPFNIVNNPMYDGATLIFTAHALYHRSFAGLLLAALVLVVYRIAILFEEPFTGFIYSQKEKEEKMTKKSR